MQGGSRRYYNDRLTNNNNYRSEPRRILPLRPGILLTILGSTTTCCFRPEATCRCSARNTRPPRPRPTYAPIAGRSQENRRTATQFLRL